MANVSLTDEPRAHQFFLKRPDGLGHNLSAVLKSMTLMLNFTHSEYGSLLSWDADSFYGLRIESAPVANGSACHCLERTLIVGFVVGQKLIERPLPSKTAHSPVTLGESLLDQLATLLIFNRMHAF